MKIDSINPIAGLDFSADSKGVFKGVEAIVYRLTANATNGDLIPILNWEIADDEASEGTLGVSTAVTESTGIFSFGSTGYWLVQFFGAWQRASVANIRFTVYSQLCMDYSTGPTWEDNGLQCSGSQYTTDTNTENSLAGTCLLHITDTDEQKIRFGQDCYGAGRCMSSETRNKTCIVFIKLAD